MSYFLKKTKRRNDVYLQIYESYRNKNKRETSHKCFKSIGYVTKLKDNGIDNPIEYYQNEVDKLNKERKEKIKTDKEKKIGEDPVKNIGYFIANNVMNTLDVDEDMGKILKIYKQPKNGNEILKGLIYSRIINSQSKLKTYTDVLPRLYRSPRCNLDQIYDLINVIGREYEKIVEVFNHQYSKKYGARKTERCYFDCTNYYFEIDKPYEDKQRGPSKENKKDQIIGMGLLLDEEMIPMTFKMYPGNESEKRQIRENISEMKNRNNIIGKTIQVADKGLNCGQNIIEALEQGDGYIFSQSINTIKEDIKEMAIEEEGYKTVKYDKEGNIDFKIKEKIVERNVEYIDEKGEKKTKKVKEKFVIYYSKALYQKKSIDILRKAEQAINENGKTTKKGKFRVIDKYTDLVVLDEHGVETKTKITKIVNEKKIKDDLRYCGYNIIISSEVNLDGIAIYDIYHKLWKIEETFRIMKTELSARPVFHRNKESIYGHFLICYLATFIIRILELKIFNNKINDLNIINFIRETNCLIGQDCYTNITKSSNVVSTINNAVKGKYLNYYLPISDLDKMCDFSF